MHRRRVAAFGIDATMVAGVSVLAVVLDVMTDLPWPGLTVAAASVWMYYVGATAWLMEGQSAGKVICELRVAPVAMGAVPHTLRGLVWSIGRHTVGYVVVDLFLVGTLLALVDRRRRCLHDYAFASEVTALATGRDRPASFVGRYRSYWEEFAVRYDELKERNRWFFFPWKLLSKALVVTALLMDKALPADAAAVRSGPSLPAEPARLLTAKAVAGLWVGTAAVSGALVVGAWPDEHPDQRGTDAADVGRVESGPSPSEPLPGDDDDSSVVHRDCSSPPAPGADADGCVEISMVSRPGPGQNMAEGMTSALIFTSNCQEIELMFSFMHQRPRTDTPPFRIREGEVRRVEGGSLWEPADAAQAEAYTPRSGEFIVLSNGRYRLETAECV